MREASTLGMAESLVFSPHMHAVFHGNVSKDMVMLPIKVNQPALYRVEFTDSSISHYYLATLYYGREAHRYQINEAVEKVLAILTLRLA